LKHLKVVMICLAALTGLAAAQAVYKSQDAQGNPVYTDQPHPGAKELELKPVNTTQAVMPSSVPMQQAAPVKTYTKIGIDVTSPIPNGLAPTTVGIIIEPALRSGDSWQLKLDGDIVASGASGSATIPTIARGNHALQVDVLSGGNIVGSSGPVEIFVFWPGGGGAGGAHPAPH